MIDKAHLLDKIIIKLNDELVNALESAESARMAATDEQSKPETQYDTLGLEASYLAHGQSERAQQIINQIHQYKALAENSLISQQIIDLGAVVLLTNLQNNKQHWYFIGPSAGGMNLKLGRDSIMVITPESPLASQLIDKECDDEITLLNNQSQSFRVDEIL